MVREEQVHDPDLRGGHVALGCLRHEARAPRRHPGSLRRAGDHLHGLAGSKPRPGGRSDHLPDFQHPALGAQRQGGARAVLLRRIVRVRHLRRRHGHLLGAIAGARVPEHRPGQAARGRDPEHRTRRYRRGLGVPIRARRRDRKARPLRAAQLARLDPALLARGRSGGGRGRLRGGLHQAVPGQSRPQQTAQPGRQRLGGDPPSARLEPRRWRPRDRDRGHRADGAGPRLREEEGGPRTHPAQGAPGRRAGLRARRGRGVTGARHAARSRRPRRERRGRRWHRRDALRRERPGRDRAGQTPAERARIGLAPRREAGRHLRPLGAD